jgi:hypothetical protein
MSYQFWDEGSSQVITVWCYCYVKEGDYKALSCSICSCISAQTGKFCLLTYQHRWRWASSFTKKFSLALNHSDTGREIHLSFASCSLSCVTVWILCGNKYSVNGLMAEARSAWTGGEHTYVLGTSPDYPINCCSSLGLPPYRWLNVLSRDSSSVHTKSVNLSDNCACARNICLS